MHSRKNQTHGAPSGRKEAELLQLWFQYMIKSVTEEEEEHSGPKEVIKRDDEDPDAHVQRLEELFLKERFRLEKQRMVYGLAVYEVIRQVSVTCIERGRLLQNLWRGWNQLNASTLSHFVEQKELQFDSLRKRVLTQKKRYDAEIERKARELDRQNELVIKMKDKYSEKTNELTQARKKQETLEKNIESLEEKLDELQDTHAQLKHQFQKLKQDRDELVRRSKMRRTTKKPLQNQLTVAPNKLPSIHLETPHGSSPSPDYKTSEATYQSLQQPLTLQIGSVRKKTGVDAQTNTSAALLKKYIDEHQESLDALPIEVTVCNAQCQTEKVHKSHRLIQCKLLDPDVVDKIRSQETLRLEQEQRRLQDRLPIYGQEEDNGEEQKEEVKQETLAARSLKLMVRNSLRELVEQVPPDQIEGDLKSLQPTNRQSHIDVTYDYSYEDESEDEEEEDTDSEDDGFPSERKKRKSPRDRAARQEELRREREKARQIRIGTVKLQKQFQKAKKAIISLKQHSSSRFAEDQLRTKESLDLPRRGLSSSQVERDVNSDDDKVSEEKKRRMIEDPKSLEEAVARDDMVLYCNHPFYRASRAALFHYPRLIAASSTSPFRRGQLFSQFALLPRLNDSPVRDNLSLSPSRVGTRNVETPSSFALSGVKSLGFNFKISLHPVHQYLQREFGVIDARDLSSLKLKKLRGNPISVKLLAKTITKIYQEFIQFYKASLSKSSELFIMRLSLAQQLYDSIHHKYGLQSVTEKSFESILGGVIKYSHFLRIQVFGRFLGVFGDYRQEDFKFYLLGLHFLLNTGDLGISIQNPDHQKVHYAPLHKAEQFTFNYFKGKLDKSDFSKLFKSVRALRVTNVATASSLDLVDIDTFLTLLISVRKQVIFPDKAAICDIYKAADFQENGCITYSQWILLARHLEPIALPYERANGLFQQHARIAKQRSPSMQSKKKSQNIGQYEEEEIEVITFDVFITLCLQNQIFLEESQHRLLGVREGEEDVKEASARITLDYESRALKLLKLLQNAGYDTWSLRRFLLMLKRNLKHSRHSYQALLCFRLLEQESIFRATQNELTILLGPLEVFTTLPSTTYNERRREMEQKQLQMQQKQQVPKRTKKKRRKVSNAESSLHFERSFMSTLTVQPKKLSGRAVSRSHSMCRSERGSASPQRLSLLPQRDVSDSSQQVLQFEMTHSFHIPSNQPTSTLGSNSIVESLKVPSQRNCLEMEIAIEGVDQSHQSESHVVIVPQSSGRSSVLSKLASQAGKD